MSRTLSKDPARRLQKEEAAALRAKARDAKATRREALRDWFQERRIQAQKRRAEAAKASRGPRGVDRVPAHLKVTRTVSLPMETPELGISTTPDGRRVQGNHQDRRRAGARGKARRPRRRELTAYALDQMTQPERAILETERLKAEKAGRPLTDRQVRERAWTIMREARFPKMPTRTEAPVRTEAELERRRGA